MVLQRRAGNAEEGACKGLVKAAAADGQDSCSFLQSHLRIQGTATVHGCVSGHTCWATEFRAVTEHTWTNDRHNPHECCTGSKENSAVGPQSTQTQSATANQLRLPLLRISHHPLSE